MNITRIAKLLVIVFGLASMAGGYAWAQGSNAPAVTSKTSSIQATVQAVFPEKRSITLLGQDGQERSIFVGPDVRLNQIRKGDKVTVTYFQGVAAQIAKDGQTVKDPAAADFASRNPNEPGGVAGRSVTVSVKILGVNPTDNTVLFQQTDGSQHVIGVHSPNMQQFIRTLKAGDHVNVTYTESVAVAVTPTS